MKTADRIHEPPNLVPEPSPDPERLNPVIEDAWRLIAPVWPLRHFVAVNPLMGLVDRPFHAAAPEVDRVYHARCTMPLPYYRQRAASGRVREADLLEADEEMTAISAPSSGARRPRARSYCDLVDAHTDGGWRSVISEELAKWCAARFDQGQAAWSLPWRELGLWSAWREWAQIDRAAELRGVTGMRAYVQHLPRDPRAALRQVLAELEVPPEAWSDFFARALLDVKGWSAHVRYLTREAGMNGRDDGDLELEFLAVRVAYEGALRAALGPRGRSWPELYRGLVDDGETPDTLRTHLIWHNAFEGTYRRDLVDSLRRGAATPPAIEPTLQAAFCIDVRSEVLRRHLEKLSPRIQTIGFAGFFGFPVAYRKLAETETSARCPVLLTPPLEVRETPSDGRTSYEEATEIRARERRNHASFISARLSTVSSFSFAETVGTWFGLRILTDSVQATSPRADGAYSPSALAGRTGPEVDARPREGGRTGLSAEEKVDLAEGALRGMGLVQDFAEVVLLCGHGSRTANNPYGSGLDCGACGGHAGEINARLAAAVLQDPAVRAALAERGIPIPEHTRFIAGLHVTTTDEVELFGHESLPEETRERIVRWLAEAGKHTREERLHGLTRGRTEGVDAGQEVRRRARDWSEVRPEWGLAKNAGFIAGRRSRTRGLDLGGRTFLHDYDLERDPERKVLEMILTAPLVVASWINMQYFASTVDNEAFGSGNKLIHNVVGRHGVMQGNQSDLLIGLPFQSVHDGEDWYHEPIRLQAIIEAPTDDLDAILARHAGVRQLVEHEWIHLMSWSRSGDEVLRRRPDGTWRPVAERA